MSEIIGLRTRAYLCDDCKHRWTNITGSVKCRKCGSKNIILRAIFGHGTYKKVNKRVNQPTLDELPKDGKL